MLYIAWKLQWHLVIAYAKQIKLMKGKALRKHSMKLKQQPRFYWIRSSVIMTDTTPLTPPNAWVELYFKKSKRHTIHDPGGPEKYNYTMMKYGRHFTNWTNDAKIERFMDFYTTTDTLNVRHWRLLNIKLVGYIYRSRKLDISYLIK